MKSLKKLTAILLAVIMCAGMLSVPAFAFDDDISVCYVSDDRCTSILYIDGDKATLSSSFRDTVSYEVLHIKQYLEVKSGSSWSKYSGGSIFSTRRTNALSIALESTEPVLPSGTYRIYGEVTLTSNGGTQKVISFYSNEATVS